MPILKQARFAALCKVNRAAVNQLISKGTLIATPDGRIDTDNPANQSYILKHNPTAILTLNDPPQPTPKPPTSKPVKAPKQKTDHKTTRPNASAENVKPEPQQVKPQGQANPQQPQPPQKPIQPQKPEPQQEPSPEQNPALSPEELNEVLRKNYYESQKIKADAQMKQVALDKLHGTLGERDVFESFVLELWQSLQRNYIDVVTKQATLVCKRLGMVGHEPEVMEVLEGDISKRMDNVAYEIKSILAGKMTQKADIEDGEEEDETETENKTGGRK